jgi:Rrf2 family protein
MNITARSRYAFKLLIALAKAGQGTRAQRSTIAEDQGVPQQFLDQIVLRLQRAGIVQSFRGRAGGITLAKLPAEVSALDIIEAAEDDCAPVSCLESISDCERASQCNSRDGWKLVDSAIRAALGGIKLTALAGETSDTGGVPLNILESVSIIGAGCGPTRSLGARSSHRRV